MSDHFALMMSGMVNTRTLGKPKVEGCGPKNLSTGRPIGHPPRDYFTSLTSGLPKTMNLGCPCHVGAMLLLTSAIAC